MACIKVLDQCFVSIKDLEYLSASHVWTPIPGTLVSRPQVSITDTNLLGLPGTSKMRAASDSLLSSVSAIVPSLRGQSMMLEFNKKNPKFFKLRQTGASSLAQLLSTTDCQSTPMIQSEPPTTPVSVRYGHYKSVDSSPFNKLSSSPPPNVPSSPSGFSGSGYVSDSTTSSKRAMRLVSEVLKNARRRALPYSSPTLEQALELRFLANSLRGGTGVNIGRDDAKKVLTHTLPNIVES